MLLLNDISTHINSNRKVIDAAIKRVIDRSIFILGDEVINFEKSFAAYVGVRECVTVANGTDALEISLRALSIEKGDLVATAANAGIYAPAAIRLIGATPYFLDVNLDSQLVQIDAIKAAINSGVKAIIVTHLYGRLVPEIQEILGLCRRHNVKLIEDCAQAVGAKKNNSMAGSFGDLSCFSFYPTKNLGALGDGGAILCDDVQLAKTLRRLRQYGWGDSKYKVEIGGGRNSRLDELHAAILSEFLPLLPRWNILRRKIAVRYSSEISHPSIILPKPPGEDDVTHLYVLRCLRRDDLRHHLLTQGISSDIHYPIPEHKQLIFHHKFQGISNSERLAEEILTIPCYPEMTDTQVSEVIYAVNSLNRYA